MEPGELSDPRWRLQQGKIIPKGIIRHPLRPKMSMTFIEEPNIYVGDNVSDTPPPNQSSIRHLLHLIKLAGAPPVAPCHSNPEAVPRPRHRGPQARCGATHTRLKKKPLAEPPPAPSRQGARSDRQRRARSGRTKPWYRSPRGSRAPASPQQQSVCRAPPRATAPPGVTC
ncbi:Phosphatidylinositol 4-kinase [Hordeum vulgare]|nr:Phosphatidylinositol 4-kinase [Hordeum vulgare]